MAQKSKKAHIVASAQPLFLEYGFKGTSIDMVVKASQVSKPTVYNHFPDKAALMHAVLVHWIAQHKPVILNPKDAAAVDDLICNRWLSDETVRIYALVIGEGWRFPASRNLFWEEFDRRWRIAFTYLVERSPELDRTTLDSRLDRRLLERLSAH